ncbi:MAG: type II secretion system protein [Gammaproteobacteria bacterium]|nr:type II secretion system protein [Gammaproteobacteria bacterium]
MSLTASRGLTLIELLVTLTILSILAAAAMPYVEMTVTRSKELELRRALREVRTAIDRYHEDWLSGKISKTSSSASDDGYPRSLLMLVDGVESAEAKGGKRRYLRRIPRDPFASADKPVEEQWLIRGYQDEIDAVVSSGNDVYDIHTYSERTALDGTLYREW